ncbi:hypothetical protein ACFO4O_09915 [Glaciecola siphonariae]|uniref:Lipoprotein n=1 Tax=Glaciecola siphonariae TaxID=521012 RepID=A0ABV9LWF1_9ALTE
MKLILSFFSLLGLSACNYVELTKFEHQNSQLFYESFDYDLPDITPFKFQGALFVSDVKAINNDEFAIWLGIYSPQKDKHVTIEKVILNVKGMKTEVNLDKEIFLFDKVAGTDLFKDSLRLLTIHKSHISSKIGVDEIDFTVYLKVNNATSSKHFILKKSSEKQQVFPT